MNANVEPAAPAPAAPTDKRRNILILIAVIFIVLGALWAAYWILVLSKRERTDDAYVNGNKVVISAQVSGTVIAVLADDTQLVKAGQALVRLDPIDAEIVEAPTNEAEFIAAARTADPHIRIVLGLIPPDVHERTNPAFAAGVVGYNRTINSTTAQLSTTTSPIAVAADGARISVAADLWDGTHPNTNGQIRIAAGFADVLARRFRLGKLYPTPFPVMPTGPLTPPRLIVRPSLTPGQAVLLWTLVPGAESYYVYVKDVTKGNTVFKRLPYPLSPKQNPWRAGLLTAGNIYAFKLQACKGADCGAYSNQGTVTAP